MNRKLTATRDIAQYLCETIQGLGFYVRYNQSSVSESMYININLGTREAPNTLHVRISNHPAPHHNSAVRFDYDIRADRFRYGTISYKKFISLFEQHCEKSLTPENPLSAWQEAAA
jgi:hypothetical protein